MMSMLRGKCFQSMAVASQVRFKMPMIAVKQVKIYEGTLTCLRNVCISKTSHENHSRYDRSQLASSTPILDGLRLSSDEQFHYLRHILGIDSADTKLHRDRFGLLREITLQTHFRVPFQNITNTFAIPLNERRISSFDDIKHAMLSGLGGICYDMNIFTNKLLDALGYNVHLVSGSFMGSERAHVTNVVHDVEVKGQRYLLDVGASDPTFHPIPLDFREESPIYQESVLTYKFRRSPCTGYLQRMHAIDECEPDIDIGLFEGRSEPDKWTVLTELDVDTDRDLDYFTEPMSHIFRGFAPPKLKHIDYALLALVYRDGKMAYIRDNICYLETERDTIERHVMYSIEEVLEAYRRYMPMIPQEKVWLGLKNRNVRFPRRGETKPLSVTPIVRYENVVVQSF